MNPVLSKGHSVDLGLTTSAKTRYWRLGLEHIFWGHTIQPTVGTIPDKLEGKRAVNGLMCWVLGLAFPIISPGMLGGKVFPMQGLS